MFLAKHEKPSHNFVYTNVRATALIAKATETISDWDYTHTKENIVWPGHE